MSLPTMPTTASDLRSVFTDVTSLVVRVTEQAAAMEALIKKGETGRADRSETKPIEVLDAKVVEGRILGKVQGVEAVYHPRITVTPRRAFACDCPDSKRRGRQVGPCKHTLALARHWLVQIQPEMDRLHGLLLGLLF